MFRKVPERTAVQPLPALLRTVGRGVGCVVLSDKNQLSQSSPTEVNLHVFKKLIKLENVSIHVYKQYT
jgi:hypothetical protein